MPRSKPCPTCGSRERYADGHCKPCKHFRTALHNGMWRGGNREILGLRGNDTKAQGNYSAAQWRTINNRGRRKRYRALRDRGLSRDQAQANLHGITVERVKELAVQHHRRQKERGWPDRVGSRAWVEAQTRRVTIL